MRLMLGTHALVWWIRADARLSERARRAIETDGTEVTVSTAVA